MALSDGWKKNIMGPLVDLVPPAPNRGDPLPPESIRLREELIRKHEEKMRQKREMVQVPVLPVDAEAERQVDALMASRRPAPQPRPIYKAVLARALLLPYQVKLDLIVELLGSLKLQPNPDSDDGAQ